MSDYAALLASLYGRRRFGVVLGTERVGRVIDALGPPPVVVRMGGTNGKGSTCALVEGALLRSGVDVGLFTSPHLCRFTERFRRRGREIDEDDLLRAAARVDGAGGSDLTFFEYATALAVAALGSAEVLILEVGLGGRLDATRAVPAQVVAVTGVELDHQEQLGPTLEAIAIEKAGSFEAGAAAVIGRGGDPAARPVLEGRARAVGAAPVQIVAADYTGPLRLLGSHQRANAACAWAVLEALAERGAVPRRAEDWAAGMAEASVPGRFELVAGAPALVLDGAHNPDGARALALALTERPERPRVAVLAVSADKDAAAIAAPILEVVDEVLVTASRHSRALSAERLAARVPGSRAVERLEDAIAEARARAGRSGMVIVCGSLFAVGEARALVSGEHTDPAWITEP